MQDHDPSVDSVAAKLASLKEGLKAARKLYDGGADHGRIGAVYALSHVIYFLCRSSVPVGLVAPLYNLTTALTDLEKGIVDPILEKAVTEDGSANVGQPRDATIEAMLKTWSAVALTLCLPASDNLEDAARKVHRAISRLPLKRRTTWKTICSWRNRIKKGDRNTNLQTQLYYELLASANSADKSPDRIAARFLRSLSDLHRRDLFEPN